MQMPDYGAPPGLPGNEAFTSSNFPPFLTKLFQIVSASSTDHCIQWTAKGDSFVISDPDTFARDILPTYFKHNNIRSFIRQLNTYGFRKRTNISSTDEHLEFFHTKFRRDDPQGLTQIKRCHQPKPQAANRQNSAADEPHPGSANYNPDLDTIRSRVTELKTRLGSLQTEIRDYNQQMEQKVNLLMHILQTSVPSGAAQGGQQQRLPPAGLLTQGGGQAGAGAGAGATGAPPAQPGHAPSSAQARAQAPAVSAPQGNNMQNELLGRRDSLLASLGQQSALSGGLGVGGGLGGGNGLGGLAGLGGGMGGLGGGGGGMGGLGGLGGGMGGLGASAGLGGLGGLGGASGLGGLMGGNGANLLGGMSGLGGMAGGMLSGLGAGGKAGMGQADDVAGLQHLLEAAQRQQTQEGGKDGQGAGGEPAAKRFCTGAPGSQAQV